VRTQPGIIQKWESRTAIVKGECCEIRTPVYEDWGGSELRELRKKKRLGIREAARLLDLSARELSELEIGALVADLEPLKAALEGK